MKLIDPIFKLSEEIIETIIHFTSKAEKIEQEKVLNAIGKTHVYINKALDYLIQIEIVSRIDGQLFLENKNPGGISNIIPTSIIKSGILNFKPFKEYLKIIQNGKNEKTAIKLVKTTFNILDTAEKIKYIFEKQIKYLEKDIPVVPKVINKVSSIPNKDNFFRIDEEGNLIYDEKLHTEKIVKEIESKRYKNPAFIDQIRIENLRNLKHPNFDLTKLIKLCEETNDAFKSENYFTVGILTRAILDHIPPIFSKKSFSELANNYGSKSFKDIMNNLENFTRKIADGFLHTQIRKKEATPNCTTVDCKNAVDILIGEIINELK